MKTKKYICYGMLLLTMLSCELDRLPTDSVVDQEFWKTEQDFQLACNAFYTELPTYTTRDEYSDICYGLSPNEFSSGSYLPENDFGPWSTAYEKIALANKIITYSKLNPNNLDLEIVNRYEGEARFFRALQYYDLLRSYGGVPIIDKLLDKNSEELYAPRNSREEVCQFILADLDFAIQGLPWASELKDTEEGRFTKGAAYALKSRVALYEGTRQKYVERGEYESLLKEAKDAALQVINSNEYSLYKDPTNDPILNFQHCFTYEGENSKEVILSNRYQKPWRKHNFSQQLLRSSANCPTRSIVDAFLCSDGLPIEQSKLFQGYDEPVSEYQNRDPRMRASILVPFEDFHWNDKPYEPRFSQNESMTGYVWKKMAVIEDAKALEGDLDVILIRYAEVLLNYAEATYELSDKINDTDLDISINELRRRVNMPMLTNSFINGDNPEQVVLDMRFEIRRERLVELANEGFRYDDLLRWGIAPEVLPKALYGIPDLREYYKLVNEKVWEKVKNGFVELQPASERVFENKHYLWPIPLVQIALNENLEQNPGW
ncbi:MAG: RagB/SusD family nutrient uptake outer membrane protein [Parabacteroides sp.]|nr:RagB/SusD family nutrient uptake outer membrane protein [Parabacteroides sp.]